jgi:hypothetical protein
MFQKKESDVNSLFRDRINVLAEKMERKLTAYHLAKDNSLANKITLSFVISGTIRVLINKKHAPQDEIKILTAIIKRIGAHTPS